MRAWARDTYYSMGKHMIRMGLKSVPAMRLPDFIGIGAQKAGTTWLAENLNCHSRVFVPNEKELHYFNMNYHTSLRYYSTFFEGRTDQKVGELTPAYSALSIDRIQLVHRLMPEARLILLLREPIARAWSQTKMHFGRHRRTNLNEVPTQDILDQIRSPHAYVRGDYRTILSNWTSVFREDQLMIGFYEELSADPIGLLSRVFEHIGVEIPTDWSTFRHQERIFAGGDGDIPEQFRAELTRIYQPTIDWCKDNFEQANDW